MPAILGQLFPLLLITLLFNIFCLFTRCFAEPGHKCKKRQKSVLISNCEAYGFLQMVQMLLQNQPLLNYVVQSQSIGTVFVLFHAFCTRVV